MKNTLRNAFAALAVAGLLTLGACKTTDDGMEDPDTPTSAPAEPQSEPTPATPTDSMTPTTTPTETPPAATPTDGTP